MCRYITRDLRRDRSSSTPTPLHPSHIPSDAQPGRHVPRIHAYLPGSNGGQRRPMEAQIGLTAGYCPSDPAYITPNRMPPAQKRLLGTGTLRAVTYDALISSCRKCRVPPVGLAGPEFAQPLGIPADTESKAGRWSCIMGGSSVHLIGHSPRQLRNGQIAIEIVRTQSP